MTPVRKYVGRFSVLIWSVLVFSSLIYVGAGSNTSGKNNQLITDIAGKDEIENADKLAISRRNSSFTQRGKASFYGRQFHGRSTANGESFDMDGFTAAHRSLPFGSIVRVYNPANNTSILVLINDRGPFVRSRVIDMARGAARCINVNLERVELEAFKPNEFSDITTFLGFGGTSYEACNIPVTSIRCLDTLSNFSEAVRKHRLLSAKTPDQNLYLIVTRINILDTTSSDSKYVFLIATPKAGNELVDTAQLLTD